LSQAVGGHPFRVVTGLSGLTRPETVDDLVARGATEFYLGYVPEWWARTLGFEVSPNRRYRRASQVTDAGLLAELVAACHTRHCQVSVTLNEHWYPEAQAMAALDVADEAVRLGVDAVIVADPAFVSVLHGSFPDKGIHVSGDSAIINTPGLQFVASQGATRIIFPRSMSLVDMGSIVHSSKHLLTEYEAFVLGEPCVYDGSRCFAEHGYNFSCDFCNAHKLKVMVDPATGQRTRMEGPTVDRLPADEQVMLKTLGKCGLCALPAMARAGVTHLKVPGRSSTVVAALDTLYVAQERMAQGMPPVVGRPFGSACTDGSGCYYPEERHG